MRFSAPFGYYHFDGFKVDVFGYDNEKERYIYSVETPYKSKVRASKAYYTTPKSRLEPNCYIIVVDPRGRAHRLYLD